MDPEHLPFVVRQHRTFFPEGFFAKLGDRFLTAYTRTYLTSPHAVAFIATVDARPVGFLVGITDTVLHRRFILRRRGLGLAARGALALCARPALGWSFARTRLPRYVRRLRPGAAPVPAHAPAPDAERRSAPAGPVAVLQHVAVMPDARSLGIGAELIDRFVANSSLAGSARVQLVTAAGAGGAGRYYEQRGWLRRGSSRTADGHEFLTYEKDARLDFVAPALRHH
ncbi:GNAT family N-acetyltransferase [Streptomyces sp. IBSNAI002]|uniref:GNAT family N-acetyltransferase n=1 Tax=Streptomyces sp. IBSNAI002 TaxID=3457500 RepID=UPI003FD55DC9